MNVSPSISIACPHCLRNLDVVEMLSDGTLIDCSICARQFPFLAGSVVYASDAYDIVSVAESVPQELSYPAKNMAAKFFKAARSEKQPAAPNRLPWFAGSGGALVALVAICLALSPAVGPNFVPFVNIIHTAFGHAMTQAFVPKDAPKKIAETGETAEAALAPEFPESTGPRPAEPISIRSDAVDGKIIVDEDVTQFTARRIAQRKIRSLTGFMHDDGLASYERAIVDMNTAQARYEVERRTSPSRLRNVALEHAQEAIDLAFCHGLETYDYLITKKAQQLKTVLEMDTTGITPAEVLRIRNQLDEGRWLTQRDEVIWWIRGTAQPGAAGPWQPPSIDVTKKGLWVHDRFDNEGINEKQTEADRKF